MKKYLIPIIVSAIVVSSYFVLEPVILPEQNTKNCNIPHDENFIKRRPIVSSSDGTPRFSIVGDFSIFYTVPIGEFAVDESTHSLILKPVTASYGYIIMCDPLPVLEKRFEKEMDGIMILVDGEETEPDWVNDALRIDVNNNTRIEIIGFSFVGGGK